MKIKFIDRVNKNIFFLGLVSFLNDLSSEMILPILPYIIHAFGGNNFIVGLVGGIRDSITNFLKFFSGYFSDKIEKRKIFIFSGYFGSAVFKLFMALSKSWHGLLIFSGFERLCKGLRDSPRDALISQYSAENRGLNFAVHRTFDTLGAILGILITILLFYVLKLEFKTILLISAVISFFSVIPILWIEKENKQKDLDISSDLVKEQNNININLFYSFFNFSKELKNFFLISITFSFANINYMFFILKTSKSSSIFLYLIFNITFVLFAAPIGRLSDILGRKKIIFIGFILFLLISLSFLITQNLFIYIFLFFLYGLSNALIDSNQRAYIADLSPENLKGTVLGLFYFLTGITLLITNLVVGFLTYFFGLNIVFIYTSIFSFLSCLLFFKKK